MRDDDQSEGMSLDDMLGRAPYMKEFLDFLPALYKESDRGMALIATSYLDDLLGRTIARALVDCSASAVLLEGFNAPLGSFSARIAAATALGLISEKEGKEADRLRKIRNAFAHSVHVSFGDQMIKDICCNLDAAGLDDGEVDENGRVRFGPRNDFANASARLINKLLLRIQRKTPRLRAYPDE